MRRHPRAKTTPEFIEEARRKHGDKFDYWQVDYVNAKTHVRIRCPEHGEFDQLPDVHLKGSGCPKCRYVQAARHRATPFAQVLAAFRQRHGNRYDYGQVQYVNLSRKITILCPQHGPFEQRPYCHAAGHGCPRCKYEGFSAAQRLTLAEILHRFAKVHGDRYDYRHVTSVRNVLCKPLILCRQHGPFRQSVLKHAAGQGCPACRESHGERRVRFALEEMGLPYVREMRFSSCRDQKPLPFDFFVPSRRYLIEYDGPQHYVPSARYDLATIRRHDAIKDAWALNRGFSLIRIPYGRFRDIPDILRAALQTC